MIVLRPYLVEDLSRLMNTINAVCGDSPWMATRSFVPTLLWTHAISVEECHCHQILIAEVNSEIIGWCRSFPLSCSTLPLQVELGIGLLSRYRNQGIGSELILRSSQWAKERGLQVVHLTVDSRNSIAVHVFTKCGFQSIHTHEKNMFMSRCLL
jgi:RimJ/RimL family protein N-acetyltransferase